MLKNLIRISLFTSLIACNSGEAKQKPVGKDISAMADSTAAEDSALAAAGSIKADEYYAKEDEQEIDSSFINYPVKGYGDDTTAKNPAFILTAGQFHEDEVSKEDNNRSWYGIFKNSNGYYIDATRISTKRVQDPLMTKVL